MTSNTQKSQNTSKFNPDFIFNDKKTSKPVSSTPGTNRGVHPTVNHKNQSRSKFITAPNKENRFLIDYLTITVPYDFDIKSIIAFMGLSSKITPDDLRINERGGLFGYRVMYHYDKIKILMDHASADTKGFCITLSGQACRQLESLLNFKDLESWREWLGVCVDLGAQITRIDLACDLYNNELDLNIIDEARDKGYYTSYFRGYERRKNKDSADLSGDTLYFGSAQSDFRIRMYNKLLEQYKKAPDMIDKDLTSWIRVEFQLRKDRAHAFFEWFRYVPVGQVFSGVLSNYLMFRNPGRDSNKSRWPVAAWWLEFLGSLERIKLAPAPVERTFLKVYRWVEKQVSASLALLSLASDKHGRDYISELLENGLGKLTDLQLNLIGYKLQDIRV